MTHPVLRIDPGKARVLCFAPHPDDEILGVGGCLRRHQQAGAELQVVLATDGVNGDPEGLFAGQDLAALRRAESSAAAARLGLGPPRSWGLPDGAEVNAADRAMVQGLAVAAMREFEPQIVYLPWAEDGHPDHRVLHDCVRGALDELGFAGEAWGYEVWTPIARPDAVVDIAAVVDDKQAALECFRSQLAYSELVHWILGLNAYRSLVLQQARGYGEALQRLHGPR